MPKHSNVCYLDIECRKIRAPEGWIHPFRFQTFLVAVEDAQGRVKFFDEDLPNLTEENLMFFLLRHLRQFDEIRFFATRDFDQMVLEGRWTSARRAHAPSPGPWPKLPAGLPWRNMRVSLGRPTFDTGDPIPSKLVPWHWDNGNRQGVFQHCEADVTLLRLMCEEKEL